MRRSLHIKILSDLALISLVVSGWITGGGNPADPGGADEFFREKPGPVDEI